MSKRPSTPELRAILAAARANVPVLIWGPPGQAKTATIETYFEQWGFGPVETVVGSLREPTDFSGLPTERDGATEYLTPSFIRRLQAADGGVLFLDEINTCSTATQAAMLRGVQERVFGDSPLPAETRIIAAANQAEYATNPRDLSPAMVNRFMHVDWRFDLSAWLDGMMTGFEQVQAPSVEAMSPTPDAARVASCRALVRSFIEANAGALNNPPTDFTEEVRGWASARSWHNLATVLPWVGEDDENAQAIILRGLVGDRAAAEFEAFRDSMQLIDPRLALKDPSVLNVADERVDRVFALAWAIRSMVEMGGDEDMARKALVVFERIAEAKPDVAQAVMTGFIADLSERFPKVELSASQIEVFGGFLVEMGLIKEAAAA